MLGIVFTLIYIAGHNNQINIYRLSVNLKTKNSTL